MSLDADSRIALLRIKIEWAKQHLRNLASDVLLADNRAVVITDANPKGLVMLPEEFVVLPQIPVEVITAAGDIVHNLRSALDHLAYQLVWVGLGHEPVDPAARLVEFPIAETPEKYEASKAGKVKGMRPEAIKAIDKLKPYKGGNDALWRIHSLDNIDKHRTLFSLGRDFLLEATWLGMDGPFWFKTESPHFAGIFDAEVEKDLQLAVDEAFTKSEVPRSNALVPALHELVDVVEHLILGFKPFLA